MNPLGRVMMVFSRSFNKRFTVFWFRQKNESKHYIDQNKNKCIVQSVGNMAWIYVKYYIIEIMCSSTERGDIFS